MSISRQADARYHSPRVRPKSVRSVGGHSDPTTPPPGAMPECHRPASAGHGPTWFPGRENLQRRLPAKLQDNGQAAADRKRVVEGKRGSGGVDLGGRRDIPKKK